MPSQTLVFIALPNGVTARNTLSLSLYLTPRLSGGTTLSQFKDFLDWPGQVQKNGLKFVLACGSRTATTSVDVSQLSPVLWQAIFTPQTYVAPYQTFGFTDRLIVSYPVRDCLSYLKYLYQTVGVGRNTGDDRGGLLELMQPLVFRQGSTSTLANARSEMRVEMWQQQHPPATVGITAEALTVSGTPAPPPTAFPPRSRCRPTPGTR